MARSRASRQPGAARPAKWPIWYGCPRSPSRVARGAPPLPMTVPLPVPVRGACRAGAIAASRSARRATQSLRTLWQVQTRAHSPLALSHGFRSHGAMDPEPVGPTQRRTRPTARSRTASAPCPCRPPQGGHPRHRARDPPAGWDFRPEANGQGQGQRHRSLRELGGACGRARFARYARQAPSARLSRAEWRCA